MELQIPHCVCAEVSKDGILRRKEDRDRKNTATTVRVEGRGDSRGRSMPGSHSYAGEYPMKLDTATLGGILTSICPDHIHMLVSIPPKVAVSSFMGYLKGKSSVLIYEKFGELKYKYRNREFWCRGYYVDTVGKNTKAIAEYIKHQLDEDRLGEQSIMINVKGNT